MSNAIGFIETKGLVSALEAATVMLKSSDVKLIGFKEIGLALVTVIISGEEQSVKDALDTASEAAGCLGEVYAVNIIKDIPREILEIIKNYNTSI